MKKGRGARDETGKNGDPKTDNLFLNRVSRIALLGLMASSSARTAAESGAASRAFWRERHARSRSPASHHASAARSAARQAPGCRKNRCSQASAAFAGSPRSR